MRGYGLYIDGCDVGAERWVHVIRASALFEDAFGLLKLKRRLDNGDLASTDDRRIVGRVAVGSPEQCEAALVAARRAQPAWAAVPFADRLAFGAAVHGELVTASA
jgi:acyl-CoA reductase-like NAD-dependent aldehyde dehydrogenase